MRANNNKRPRGRQPAKRPVNQKYANFDSNGPDVRVRGNAMQVYEKYVQLAKDVMSEDRFKAENYLQHAEHYYRIYQSAVAQEESRREERMGPRGDRPERHDRRGRPEQEDGVQQPVEPQAEAVVQEVPIQSAPQPEMGIDPDAEQPDVPEGAVMPAMAEGEPVKEAKPRARRSNTANARARDRHPTSRRGRSRAGGRAGEEGAEAPAVGAGEQPAVVTEIPVESAPASAPAPEPKAAEEKPKVVEGGSQDEPEQAASA